MTAKLIRKKKKKGGYYPIRILSSVNDRSYSTRLNHSRFNYYNIIYLTIVYSYKRIPEIFTNEKDSIHHYKGLISSETSLRSFSFSTNF